MNITELIKSRRTIRKFRQKKLTREQIEKYIDAARVAPSAANMQSLKYAAVVSREMADRMFEMVKWAGYLSPEYNPKDNERPTAYIVVCVDTDIRKTGHELDAGAAVENIILSALEDGVGACWMGAIDRVGIKEILNLPECMEISCLVALGYSAEEPKEVEIKDSVKYYLNDEGILCVPKRSLEDVIISID